MFGRKRKKPPRYKIEKMEVGWDEGYPYDTYLYVVLDTHQENKVVDKCSSEGEAMKKIRGLVTDKSTGGW